MKRYTLCPHDDAPKVWIDVDPANGEWVKYDDYAALERELDMIRAQLSGRDALRVEIALGLPERIKELERELAEARDALDGMTEARNAFMRAGEVNLRRAQEAESDLAQARAELEKVRNVLRQTKETLERVEASRDQWRDDCARISRLEAVVRAIGFLPLGESRVCRKCHEIDGHEPDCALAAALGENGEVG